MSQFPWDVIILILNELNTIEMIRVVRVCKAWRDHIYRVLQNDGKTSIVFQSIGGYANAVNIAVVCKESGIISSMRIYLSVGDWSDDKFSKLENVKDKNKMDFTISQYHSTYIKFLLDDHLFYISKKDKNYDEESCITIPRDKKYRFAQIVRQLRSHVKNHRMDYLRFTSLQRY